MRCRPTPTAQYHAVPKRCKHNRQPMRACAQQHACRWRRRRPYARNGSEWLIASRRRRSGERGERALPYLPIGSETLAGSMDPKFGPLSPFHVRSKNDPAATISGLVQRNYPTPPDSISFTKINVPAGDRSHPQRCLFNTIGFESRGPDRWIPIGRSDVCRRRSVSHLDGQRSENRRLKTNRVLERISGRTSERYRRE